MLPERWSLEGARRGRVLPKRTFPTTSTIPWDRVSSHILGLLVLDPHLPDPAPNNWVRKSFQATGGMETYSWAQK